MVLDILLHSYILSNFSDTAAVEKINEIAGISLGSERFKQHPDITHVYPQVNEKTILQKPSIKIEQVRNLKIEFNKDPTMLPVQIAVLWQAQHLTVSASNALLKLLEEPSGKSMIFLAVDSYHHLLPTIQSRCQIVIAGRSQACLASTETEINLKSLYQADTGERMDILATACPSQKEALEWLAALIHTAREKLPRSTPKGMKSLGQLLENAQTIYNDISIFNVNYKLALDMLAMHWDKNKIQDL